MGYICYMHAQMYMCVLGYVHVMYMCHMGHARVMYRSCLCYVGAYDHVYIGTYV